MEQHTSLGLLFVTLLILNLTNIYSARIPCEGAKPQVCFPGTFYDSTNCVGCTRCPAGSYSDQWSTHSYCKKCRICQGVFTYQTNCSSIRNAVCQCAAGFRCRGENCVSCVRNCDAGQEPAEDGCRSCPPGTFSNLTELHCIPWLNCTAQGRVVLKNGTNKMDVVCGPSPTADVPVEETPYNPEGNTMVHVVLIVISVLFVMSVVVFTLHLMVWSKKKVKNIFKPVPHFQLIQTAQQEDACSCRFPEEEEGEAATATFQTALSA
uniref:Tumor necrosis factor receptor superfamily member 9 n=1 Tax=Geotrypetes seraphini TaxID=260995 RepID=A0A6P8PR14_GEOSA|nr:tumor necrosis factor receptor superfamily member 9 [Geotrypetes seraphini]XP_033777159.1 tumor necrosis factor receptor superfamily member 9 [Geotrypetes seraphini]